MAARLDLVSASAGKRLSAKLIDMLIPSIVLVAALMLGATTIVSTRVNAQVITVDLSWFVVWSGVGVLLGLAYGVFLWAWEAKTGKTIGNALLGIRTTGMKGFAPGWLAVLVRNVIVALGFAVAFIGGVLVMLSNLWDQNGRRQGWQDKAAHTLVFDVKAGRDPLISGGIDGPASFAPFELPPMVLVQSPVAGTPSSAQVPAAQATELQPPSTPEGTPPSSSGTDHFDVEAGPTTYRPRAAAETMPQQTSSVTTSAPTLRVQFDDGRDVLLTGVALIGRNPGGYDGDVIAQLIDVPDPSRSVSKTHLQVQTGAEGLWVTDRNSTNGSAITEPDGTLHQLVAGIAELAVFGSTVRFGDRTFLVGRA